MGYHQILLQAFSRLHGLSQAKLKIMRREFMESDQLIATSEFLQESGSMELHRKALRVKAFKAHEFLSGKDTPQKVLLSTVFITPLERMMWKFLEWQGSDECLSAELPPLVQMTHETLSPWGICLDELRVLFTTGSVQQSSCALRDLAKGQFPGLQVTSIQPTQTQFKFKCYCNCDGFRGLVRLIDGRPTPGTIP